MMYVNAIKNNTRHFRKDKNHLGALTKRKMIRLGDDTREIVGNV